MTPRSTLNTTSAPVFSDKTRTSRGFVEKLQDLYGLYLERRHLSKLDDAALRDIGVSRGQAAHEVGRAPWDVPAHWRA